MGASRCDRTPNLIGLRASHIPTRMLRAHAQVTPVSLTHLAEPSTLSGAPRRIHLCDKSDLRSRIVAASIADS